MQSTEQNLELVVVDHLDGILLHALSYRLARQQGKDVDSRVIVRCKVQCGDKDKVSAFSSLMRHCREVELRRLQVDGDIGWEGWAVLREALSLRLHDIPRLNTCFRTYLASARKEDLRAIWECLSHSLNFCDFLKFEKQRGEEGWNALERFLDFTDEEWRSRKRALLSIMPEHLFVNREQWQHPLANLAVGPVLVHLGEALVEVQLQQPGGQGLQNALQQAMLFHPAFWLEPELDQAGDVQDDMGQADQVEDVQDVNQAGKVQDEEGQGHDIDDH